MPNGMSLTLGACHCKKPCEKSYSISACHYVQMSSASWEMERQSPSPLLRLFDWVACTCKAACREANQATPIRLFCRCFGVSRSRGCRRAFSESLLSRYPISDDITRSYPNLPSFSPVVTRPSFMKCTSACTSVEDICETLAFCVTFLLFVS